MILIIVIHVITITLSLSTNLGLIFPVVQHKEREDEEPKGTANRGNTTALAASNQQFIFIWGCRPMYGILGNSKMVFELVDRFRDYLDFNTGLLLIPNCFDDLTGVDASFEVVQS